MPLLAKMAILCWIWKAEKANLVNSSQTQASVLENVWLVTQKILQPYLSQKLTDFGGM